MGLCGRCLSVWGPEPHTLPPYTLVQWVHVQYGGGGKSWTREKVRGATIHKAAWFKDTNNADIISSLETMISACRQVP